MKCPNSNMNFDLAMELPLQYQNTSQQNIHMNNSLQNLQNMLINNFITHNNCIPDRLIKTGLCISSSNLPQQIKSTLIQNVLFNNQNSQINQSNQSVQPQKNSIFNTNTNINLSTNNNSFQNHKSLSSQRILFKKDEDERIKKLVKIFGTRHWDLVAQFMVGRTAKQCRDRYSNYLMPGFFQGEWSEEEDNLLIKLYKEHGPKWSAIQKSFRNRSANNIKNRWYYFLCKKTQINDENEMVTESCTNFVSNIKTDEIQHYDEDKQLDQIDNADKKENDVEILFQQENDIFDFLNNDIETDTNNNWMI